VRRLYLRIYVAVLASLVAFSLLLGLAWHLGPRGERPQSVALLADLADELLPAGAAPDVLAASLARWRARTGADLALFDPDGRVIASAGAPLPRPQAASFDGERGAWVRRHDAPPAFALRLSGDRVVVASRAWRAGVFGGPGAPGFVATIAFIALAIGVGAYPVVRRLTRRLEQLQRTVEKLGEGDLSARVAVSGRDEVASLAHAFNRSAQRIEALVESNKRLLANASHELRSPLARIRVAVELLGERAGDATREELVRNVAELDQLVDEILLMSRLDAGARAPDAAAPDAAIDLTALVAEECARADVPLEAVALEAAGDARLLRRLVRNLLENALRHGAGAPVEVRLQAAATRDGTGSVVIEVCDRGPGVTPDERERIFEPFYRARGASERSGGVGLGLALVRQIARLHRGDVECVAREGGGSCFRVTLPRR